MPARFRIPARPILPQQLADIYDRLDELEGERGGGIGGIGIGGAGGGIPGSGTPNAIPKWITAGSLGDSRFLDDGIATDLSYGDYKHTSLFITTYGYQAGEGFVPKLIPRYARGIQGAITPVLANDILGVFAARGCDYAGHFADADNAKIMVQAAGDWDPASHPTNIGIWTTNFNEVIERMRVAVNAQGSLIIFQSNTPYTKLVGFRVPTDIVASQTYTLPKQFGTAGQVLTTDASGNLSWATAPGGGIGGWGTPLRFAMFSAPTTISNAPLFIDTSLSGSPIRAIQHPWRFEQMPITLLNYEASPPANPSSYMISLYILQDSDAPYRANRLSFIDSYNMKRIFVSVQDGAGGRYNAAAFFMQESGGTSILSSQLKGVASLTCDAAEKVYYGGVELNNIIGINKVVSFKDGDGGHHTLTFTKGLLTTYVYNPPP